MSNEFGYGSKKETVYSGPGVAVQPGPDLSRSARTMGGGTVGPTPGGTVYNPPMAGAAASPTSPPRLAGAASTGATKGAGVFFLIAGFTAVNMVVIFAGFRFAIGLGATMIGNDLATFAVANLLAIGLFVLLGVFAKKGSKAAFLIGMLLYGGDLLVLAMNNPQLHIVSMVIHGYFLWRLIQAFRELPV